MPKYKVRLVPPGDYIYWDGSELCYVGASASDAFDFLDGEGDEDRSEWVHPCVLRGRVLYKADIEAGDGHEDAEPGDTTYDTVIENDSERALAHELKENELLCWPQGPVRSWWTYGPEPWDGVTRDVPQKQRYHANVGKDELGIFESREEAEAAVQAEVAKRVQAWKDAHPEFHRALPVENDEVQSAA